MPLYLHVLFNPSTVCVELKNCKHHSNRTQQNKCVSHEYIYLITIMSFVLMFSLSKQRSPYLPNVMNRIDVSCCCQYYFRKFKQKQVWLGKPFQKVQPPFKSSTSIIETTKNTFPFQLVHFFRITIKHVLYSFGSRNSRNQDRARLMILKRKINVEFKIYSQILLQRNQRNANNKK